MSFKKSLDIGALGETIYFEAQCGKLKRLDGLKADFQCMSSGDLYELKTDTYKMESTPNLFIEKTSNISKNTTGGPFRALENGCKYFVYFYINNLTLCTFETQPLVDFINKEESSLKVVQVPNSGWITKGFVVNRDLVKHLYIEEKIEVRIKK